MPEKTNVEKLQDLCTALLPARMWHACMKVLNDPKFATAPAAATHHHNYDGGLAEHTLEVAQFAMEFAKGFGVSHLALVAAIFHDFHKVHEYVFVVDKIEKTPYLYETGHVVGSWEYFRAVAHAEGFSPDEIDAISHALLAHHGRREWGSPVEPATPLAWALHSADMLSSRGYGK